MGCRASVGVAGGAPKPSPATVASTSRRGPLGSPHLSLRSSKISLPSPAHTAADRLTPPQPLADDPDESAVRACAHVGVCLRARHRPSAAPLSPHRARRADCRAALRLSQPDREGPVRVCVPRDGPADEH